MKFCPSIIWYNKTPVKESIVDFEEWSHQEETNKQRQGHSAYRDIPRYYLVFSSAGEMGCSSLNCNTLRITMNWKPAKVILQYYQKARAERQ